MSKVYEITIWKPKTGKWAEAKKNMQDVAVIFKNAGVSEVQILEGSVGKDVGNLIMIQTYKGLADNGVLNEKLGEDSAFQNWMKEHGKDDYATLVSHDLYIES